VKTVAMFAKCQKRTRAPPQNASLFDHLIGAGEKRGNHIGRKVIFGRQLHPLVGNCTGSSVELPIA